MTGSFYLYGVSLAVGLVWLVVQAMLGGGGDLGVDLDGGGDGGSSVSFLKPVVLATTLAIFGVVGIITSWGGWLAPLPIVGLAIVLGLFGGYVVLRVLGFLTRAQGNDTQSADQFIGMEGELTVGCSDQQTGEVVFDTGRAIQQYSARPLRPGTTVERGTRVVVRRISGGLAYVEPADRPSDPLPQ